MSADVTRVVEAQLGRPSRSEFEVKATCALGLPVVIDVPPVLEDGTPFPTTYWLTCPLAAKRIGRIEGVGGVKQLERFAEHDTSFGAALDEAHARYARDRDARLPDDLEHVPSGDLAVEKADQFRQGTGGDLLRRRFAVGEDLVDIGIGRVADLVRNLRNPAERLIDDTEAQTDVGDRILPGADLADPRPQRDIEAARRPEAAIGIGAEARSELLLQVGEFAPHVAEAFDQRVLVVGDGRNRHLILSSTRRSFPAPVRLR